MIERAVIMGRSRSLHFDLRPPRTDRRQAPDGDGAERSFVPAAEWKRRERRNLEAALEQTGWKIYGRDGAATLLGLKPTTLASRIRALGLRRLLTAAEGRPRGRTRPRM